MVPKFGLRLLNFRSFVTVKPSQTSYSCAHQRCSAFKCGDSRLHATEESNSISDAYISGNRFNPRSLLSARMFVAACARAGERLEGVNRNHPTDDRVLSVFEMLLLSQRRISWRRSRPLSAGAFHESQMEAFLSHLPGSGSLFFFFFYHLGWNISEFAHKWETERIPACLSHIVFYICLAEGIFFSPLQIDAYSMSQTFCARAEGSSQSGTFLLKLHTWEHPSFRDKVVQVFARSQTRRLCVW